MRFPTSFQRYVGANAPANSTMLGSDAPPVGHPRTHVDNQLEVRLSNINGFTVQRIAVGCIAPDGAHPMPAFIYVHDDNTGGWLRSRASPIDVVPGSFSYFDVPVLADNANVNSESVGSLEVALVVGMPAKQVAGAYTFIMGGDVSCPA